MTEELLKALQLIKDECKKQGSKCYDCPMYSHNELECGVMSDNPCNWRLEKREVYF